MRTLTNASAHQMTPSDASFSQLNENVQACKTATDAVSTSRTEIARRFGRLAPDISPGSMPISLRARILTDQVFRDVTVAGHGQHGGRDERVA